MTCREKLKIEHPEFVCDGARGGCINCPPTFGYLKKQQTECYGKNGGSDERCTRCWNREIPGTEPRLNSKYKPRISNMQDLLWFVERVMAKGDKTVSIYIRNNDMQISVYPYPEQEDEEK